MNWVRYIANEQEVEVYFKEDSVVGFSIEKYTDETDGKIYRTLVVALQEKGGGLVYISEKINPDFDGILCQLRGY